MSFFKKNIKWIITVIILIILTNGISLYAVTTYLASEVSYKEGRTVESALDDLYSKIQSGEGLTWKYDEITVTCDGSRSWTDFYDCGFRPSYCFYQGEYSGGIYAFSWYDESDSKFYIYDSNNRGIYDGSPFLELTDTGVKFIGWGNLTGTLEIWTVK